MKKLLILTTVFLTAVLAYAQDRELKNHGSTSTTRSITLPVIYPELKPGEGKEKVDTLCNICHSTDYITMQPKFSKAVWTTEVDKMIKVMGAPINGEDARVIINYLAANYGTGN